MRGLMIFFVLVLAISACKKTREENSKTPTLKVGIISPADGATVQTGKAVQFSWSLSTNFADPITNKIKIVEITADQSPEQAFRTNKPIFEKDSMAYIHTNKPIFEKDSTIYLNVALPYSAGSPGLVIGKKYAWGVTATQKLTSNESKVSMFTAIR